MLCTGASPQRYTANLALFALDGMVDEGAHLVVEATCLVEVFKEFRVNFAAPEVHVGDLEVAPDCVRFMLGMLNAEKRRSLQWQRLYVSPPSSDM